MAGIAYAKKTVLFQVICANIHDNKVVAGCQYGVLVVWDLPTVLAAG
jgi:hypothetical protein